MTALKHPPENYEVSQDDAKSITNIRQFIEKIENYLTVDTRFDITLATKFIEELKNILQAIESSNIFPEYEMVGTSLLFIHCNGHVTIRWIDFANTYKPSSQDHNGIREGVNSLIELLSDLIRSHL